MPGTEGIQVVVWEERPHGLNWVSWGFNVVPLALVTVGMAYAVVRVPGPPVFRVVAIAALCVGGVMLVIYGRRVTTHASGRITLDMDRRRLYAENLKLERGFWPQARTPFYECAFDDINSIRIRRSRHVKWLHIDCAGGRLVIDDVSCGFGELLAALREVAPEKRRWSRKDVVTSIVMIGATALICWACVHFGWI
jgi:hypothetical protein